MKHIYSSIAAAMVLCLMAFLAQAQDKTEKETISINLAYSDLNGDLPVIKASAKTKKEKRFEPVEGIEINLFFGDESATGFMGKLKTNSHGVGSMTLPLRFKQQWDTASGFKFIGTLTGNDRFGDQSSELEVTKAKIELTLEDADSVHKIHAKVTALEDNKWVAQPETEVKLVVRGMMSDLAATEEETFTTDKNGEIAADFVLAMPGDPEGYITIGAKIDEHEVFGSLVSTKSAKWGLAQAPDNSFAKRTLWATRDKTPLWLLIFPNLIIVCVWGIIFYLLYQITRLIKLGKANDAVKLK